MGFLTLSQFQGTEISPGLFQNFIEGYIRLSTLAVEHSVVVMTAGSQSRRSQIESYGYAIFDSRFIKFVFRIRGETYLRTLALVVRVHLPLD